MPIIDLDKNGEPNKNRPIFPGFKAAFGIEWEAAPFQTIEIPDGEIEKFVFLDDAHQRVYKTVDIYAERILKALRTEDQTPDIWFVIIPEVIYKNCRPLSTIKKDLRVEAKNKMPDHARGRTGLEFDLQRNDCEQIVD